MAKYHIGKVKKIRFARFGGLSSVNQLGYDSKMPDFHSPPASRGFYCFVWPFYEMFLLGAGMTKAPYVTGAKFIYVRDGKGNIIDEKHPEYTRLTEMNDYFSKYWTCESKQWKDFKRKNDWPGWRDDPDEDDACEKRRDDISAKWDAECKHLPQWVLVEKPRPRIFEYDGELWHHLGKNLRHGAIIAQKGGWTKSTVYDYRDALDREMHNAQRQAQTWMKEAKDKFPALLGKKRSLNIGGKDHLECFIEKL